jgi:thioredoxin-like negative regulator of GroEL
MDIGLERILLAGALLIGFVVAGKMIAAMNRRSVRVRMGAATPANNGRPTLFYFWTTDCAACPVQEQQIEEARSTLAKRGKHFDVKQIDALEDMMLARSMNVMTVPTTVLLDARGKVVAWNAGLREARAIVAQLEAAGPYS